MFIIKRELSCLPLALVADGHLILVQALQMLLTTAAALMLNTNNLQTGVLFPTPDAPF